MKKYPDVKFSAVGSMIKIEFIDYVVRIFIWFNYSKRALWKKFITYKER